QFHHREAELQALPQHHPPRHHHPGRQAERGRAVRQALAEVREVTAMPGPCGILLFTSPLGGEARSAPGEGEAAYRWSLAPSPQPSPTERAFTPVFDGLWGEGARLRSLRA